jgi:hypothetical protein
MASLALTTGMGQMRPLVSIIWSAFMISISLCRKKGGKICEGSGAVGD